MTDPYAPTEALRRLTRPLEVPVWADGARFPVQGTQGACCTRCGGLVEPLSQGHYQDGCLLTMTQGPYHFCCPAGPGCELRAP